MTSRAATCLLLSACATAGPAGAPPAPGRGDDPTPPSVAAATRLATRADGPFACWHRPDGAVLVELGAGDLDREVGLVAKITRGVGEPGLLAGTYLSDTRVVSFHRVGDRVLLIDHNLRARARPGSGWDASIAAGPGDSVLAALPVVGAEADVVLADLTGFLLTDYVDLAESLRPIYEPRPIALDDKRSLVTGVTGHRDNVEIDTLLTYTAPTQPAAGMDSVADARAVSVGVRTSLFALPETPMAARTGDDRVGYFGDLIQDPSRATHELYEIIRRRRLEKRDPSAPRSPPIEPIVFVIDPSVPPEWRATVREGILAWNRAFEDAGFTGAIVVRDPGPGYDPDGLRVSVVRWVNEFNAQSVGLALDHVDPRSGEILDADVILVSGIFGNAWYDLFAALTHPPAAGCGAGGLGLAAARLLTAGGARSYTDVTREFIRQSMMHEIGHTLGLRHNFRASASVPFARLGDRAFVERHGTTASVMDYAGPNIALDPDQQTDLYSRTVGPYDRWAIRYGYETFAAGAEAAGLAAILDEASEPEHAYASDDDQWLGDLASDPAVGVYDLGDDPVAWARLQEALFERALPRLRDTFVQPGDSYRLARPGFEILLQLRQQAAEPLLRSVGGFSASRIHRGQRDERPPLVPIAAGRQREALAALIEMLLSEKASRFPPELLGMLAPYRGAGWTWALFRGETRPAPIAFPLHQTILALQTRALASLVHPARLQRLADTAAYGVADPLTITELVTRLTDEIFDELLAARARPASEARRGLQLAWLDLLAGLARREPPPPDRPSPVASAPWRPEMPPIPLPAEASAAARAQLVRLERRAAAVAGGHVDERSRAHAALVRARAHRALTAQHDPPRDDED